MRRLSTSSAFFVARAGTGSPLHFASTMMWPLYCPRHAQSHFRNSVRLVHARSWCLVRYLMPLALRFGMFPSKAHSGAVEGGVHARLPAGARGAKCGQRLGAHPDRDRRSSCRLLRFLLHAVYI